MFFFFCLCVDEKYDDLLFYVCVLFVLLFLMMCKCCVKVDVLKFFKIFICVDFDVFVVFVCLCGVYIVLGGVLVLLVLIFVL